MPEVLNSVIPSLRQSKGVLVSVSQGKRRRYSYAEVYDDVLRVRGFLAKRRLHAGSVVGIVADNCYEWLLLDLACLSIGIVLAPFDPKVHQSAADLVRHYRLDALFSDRVEAEHADDTFPLSALLTGNERLDEMAAPFFRYDDDSIVCMKFTSGTTNLPKGIPAKAQNIDDCVRVVQATLRHAPEDRILVFLPLYVLQQRYFFYSSILYEHELAVVPYVHALSSIIELEPTVVMAVPHFLETLYQRFVISSKVDAAGSEASASSTPSRVFGKRLRYLWTGSAPISRRLLDCYGELNIPVYQGYGTAETGILTKNWPGNNRLGSVGKVLQGREVKISDSGEVLARNRAALNTHYCIGSVYEIGERFVDEDSFFHTGDEGYFDTDGYLYITGRIKNLIVLPNGRKIHPEPIEAAIASHVGIEACVVFGTESGRLNAVIDSALPDEVLRQLLEEVRARLSLDEPVRSYVRAQGAFTSNSNLRNAQGKVVRNLVYTRYKVELEALGMRS